MSRFARAAVAAAGAGFALGVQLGSSSSSVSAQPATRSSIAGVYRLVPAAADDVAAGLLVEVGFLLVPAFFGDEMW